MDRARGDEEGEQAGGARRGRGVAVAVEALCYCVGMERRRVWLGEGGV